jgi:hypothetical protein
MQPDDQLDPWADVMTPLTPDAEAQRIERGGYNPYDLLPPCPLHRDLDGLAPVAADHLVVMRWNRGLQCNGCGVGK